MSEMTWHGVPVTFRPWGEARWHGDRPYVEVLVDEVPVGTVWRTGDGWRWHLSGSTTTGENCPTRRRATDALLAAYGTALGAWATP